MAATDEWFVGEDGCLSIGEPTTAVTYHSTLNAILVATKGPAVKVIDVTSGSVLQKSDLCASKTDNLKCLYLPAKDKVVFSDGIAVGVRRDASGVLLLDTALQTAVGSTDDVVKVELALPEANHLFQCLMSAELPGMDGVEDVIRELEKGIEHAAEATKRNHKVAKWATVCINLPHSTLKSVCSNLMTELKRLNQHVAGLPVASAVTDRLGYLLLNSQVDVASGGPVDRAIMYSEAARRETFGKWPHMNYKWALPDPMAQAGFYHQPTSTGDDRAMCFTCNVCLVCWEPTDEPWSEHERHSPSCPFVKGEYTQNVPLTVTTATQPAQAHGGMERKIECISASSSEDLLATSTLHGNVVVWDIARQLKKHVQFNIDPSDTAVAVQIGNESGERTDTVCDAMQGSASTQPASTTEEETENKKETHGSAEIIEVTGAWRQSAEEIIEIPLDGRQSNKSRDGFAKRSRVSQDVLVSSLCMIGPGESSPSHQGAAAFPMTSLCTQTCLISGTAVRKSAITCDNMTNDVQAMNRVNEVLSSSMEGTLDIISEQHSITEQGTHNPYIPYLLVHNIRRSNEVTSAKKAQHKTSSVPKTTVSEMYMPQIMEVDEEDIHTGSLFGSGSKSGGGTKSGKVINFIDNTTKVKTSPEKETSNSSTICDEGEGRVVQCLPLPETLAKEEYCISSILPTVDNQYIIVVVTPRVCNSAQNQDKIASISSENSAVEINSEEETGTTSTKDGATPVKGGALLLYKLKFDGDIPLIDNTPIKTMLVPNVEDSIIKVLTLPLEIANSHEEDELINFSDKEHLPRTRGVIDSPMEQIAAITTGGKIKLLGLSELRQLAEVEVPEDSGKFVSLTYCSGMDRLCACTDQGKLMFFQVGPKGPEFSESDMLEHSSPMREVKESATSASDSVDSGSYTGNDFLVKQPCSTEVLMALHELTQFENLMPRFSATVPPCWNEIQQEQQHRRHPQHLQQQGEALQHTRSWKLQADKTSYDEHMIELVLPKPCCVGHVDLKFTLHPLCTSVPNVQVTLLKQNITNIGRQMVFNAATDEPSPSIDVDSKIDFKMETEDGAAMTQEAGNSGKETDKKKKNTGSNGGNLSKTNNVLDSEFLEHHHAEILSGPVDLASCLDLSGQGGLITLTSPKLLKEAKSRSFLVHIKALQEDPNKIDKSSLRYPPPPPNPAEAKKKSVWDQFYPGIGIGSAVERLAQTAPKTKLENVKGCDWLSEISVTIRKTKRTAVPKDRLQRCMMLEMPSFHEQLVLAVCGGDDKVPCSTSLEHRQGLALDILCWVTAVQMKNPVRRLEPHSIVYTIQGNLEGLVKSCYIEGNRTVAHKCSKLLALCMEYSKVCEDQDMAAAFSYSLLQALLACLPSLPSIVSAGALRWYFTLLNRVKCMDIDRAGRMLAEMMSTVAKNYYDRTTPIDALLKARFGLYGNPCDPELFDIELPTQVMRPNVQAQSYSSMVGGSSGSTTDVSGTGQQGEDVDFQDLISLNPEKSNTKNIQNDVLNSLIHGLLEVEPLHFTCHATSDGTRMERIDSANGPSGHTSSTSGLSGTINFGDGLATVTAAAGVALQSLSTAMASAEQQLSLLQHKQAQLLKLQQQKQKLEQKLAETQKNVSASSSHSQLDIYTPTPTPKTTPLFMTPPVTPPNEAMGLENVQKAAAYMSGLQDGLVTGKPPTGKTVKLSNGKSDGNSSKPVISSLAPTHQLLQIPPQQVLVIERLHSGARRFVVLDFGKPVLLTDVIIPACGDLASLSIDVWIHGEEVDGQRLVVSSDIGIRSLIMNDLMPPAVCRYLKITTVGRYGGGTTRSRIPIGSFYGHTYILPWEYTGMTFDPLAAASPGTEPSFTAQPLSIDHSQILSQLGIIISLQEDIQCRYSLACNRLQSLLADLDLPQSISGHAKYYLRKLKRSDEDNKILTAYNDCVQLQLQLNLAEKAIERLQQALGMRMSSLQPRVNTVTALKQASTDKLRVLTELLLDTLLSMTSSKPTIPNPPPSLYTVFDPRTCQELFKNVCVYGSRRVQIHAGLLLVRIGGTQGWWGQFLGNVLQEYFSSDLTTVLPQDRIFVLLTALGQKSLDSSSATTVLESLLCLLAKILSPLMNTQGYGRPQTGSLDLDLIGWVLLFLSRTLDTAVNNGTNGNKENGSADEASKAGAASAGATGKENGTNGNPVPSRWDFIQGDGAMETKNNGALAKSKKIYRRKLHKRMLHHKQKLMDLEKAKKEFMSSMPSTEQEKAFKKEIQKYASKHFKDIVQIRRTDGEALKKTPKESENDSASNGGSCDIEVENNMTLPRERCLPVVRGLVVLLLSMDFTCNVDLFLITCKVIARICSSTRPAITLSEAMTQEQLTKLLLLSSNLEFNHGNISWGGAWARHAMTCMVQDILDGERLYPAEELGATGITDDEISAVMTETDDSLPQSVSLPQLDESELSAAETTGPTSVSDVEAAMKDDPKFPMMWDDLEPQVISLIEDDAYVDFDKLWESVSGESVLKQPPGVPPPFFPEDTFMSMESGNQSVPTSVNKSGTLNMLMGLTKHTSNAVFKKKQKMLNKWPAYRLNRGLRASVNGADKSRLPTPAISTAMDARMEYHVDASAELKLKVMQSMESEGVQSAITSSLPVTPDMGPSSNQDLAFPQPVEQSTTDDEQLSETSFLGDYQLLGSSAMLSTCFDGLFTQLQMQRVNLDTILQLWLTFNDDSGQEDANNTTFDPSTVPSIPLSQSSLTCLLNALIWQQNIPVRTWTLAFRTLTLLMNVKLPVEVDSVGDKWLASVIVCDPSLVAMMITFLSGMSQQGPVLSSQQYTQVGPTATKMFHEFLVRLQLRAAESHEQQLKEMLLKLVYTLTAERGAFHNGIGPLDAQCKLLDHILEQGYENVDINNAISVIESVSALVHHHILSQEKVHCRSQSDGTVSARSCFGGLFSSLLRPGDSKSMVGEASRDVLMCSLLKLVNKLVEIRIPGRTPETSSDSETEIPVEEQSVTDSSKLSQSRGVTAAVETATPPSEAPKSDEEKGAETDEQKSENAVNTPTPSTSGTQQAKPKTCTHTRDPKSPDAHKPKEPTLSDIILTHNTIMTHFLQALSFCNSNTMAMILCSSGLQGSMQDSFAGIDVLSVGDGVFQILCTLNRRATDMKLIIQPVFNYLSSGFHGSGNNTICKLSEPLLWFILRVLDCEKALRVFLDIGGVEVVCNNLVNSNRRTISTCPSLISTLMQYLGNNKGSANVPKRTSPDSENTEGMHNFAPQGTISSSSPTAGPADVLIQSSPPHRRARSAAWSYHFYPDEAWVDLTIQLPCAVLLKEVQIQPHWASLATCPSMVSLEISKDGSTVIPICPPVQSSGLTFIKLQLLKAEVASSVTIRLHKPRDSSTIGLSHILVMGYTAFGETTAIRNPSVFTPTEDYVSRTSIGWLRLLHHCLTQVEDISEPIAAAAAPSPSLLNTCTALLLSSTVHTSNVEAVLLKIGLYSTEMGLGLIDNLLRNATLGDQDQSLLHGKVNGMASESTIDLIYQLGMTQDEGTATRVQALADWLGDTARVALQKHGASSDDGYRPSPRDTQTLNTQGLPNPAPAHVHCIAAIFWQSQQDGVEYDLKGIITRELLSSVYEWSTILPSNSTLKKSVDSVICAMCHIHPVYFTCLLEWMAIIMNLDISATDDDKDGSQQMIQHESLTDDTKEARGSQSQNTSIEGATAAVPSDQPITLQDFGHMILDESHLATLGTACQSESAIKQLLDSGFPAVLAQALFEFCTREVTRFTETMTNTEAIPEGSRSGMTSPRGRAYRRRESSDSVHSDKYICLTADLVAPVLQFFTEAATESVMKDWLGSLEGNVFWPVLLNMLCNTPQQTSFVQPTGNQKKIMTSHQRASIETATVNFYSRLIRCHSTNQKLFAQVLCDVIRGQGCPGQNNVICQNSPLSGFTRRLFLQVLLEDEKVLVAFKSTSQLYKGHINASTSVIQHPKYGAGHKYRTMLLSLQMTCGDVLSRISDTPSLTAQLLESREEKKKVEALDKDTTELGLEVVDYLSQATGLKDKSAKDKQNSQKASGSGFLPRPPTRRGRLPVESPSLAATMQIPVLSLYHKIMAGQPLPSDLTLSQLLVLLHNRGLPEGTHAIEFSMKLRAKKVLATKSDKRVKQDQESIQASEWDDTNDPTAEYIPEEVLLETATFPSALQVFASVGGLALLAEHLPLLYPEITRQVSPPDVGRDTSGTASIGHDWVTVESSEDLYEEIYEPMPPSQSGPSRQATPPLPSVPPHSLVAFGLFLRLPGYAEVLLKERKRAQCLLRLVLGVTDDGEGGHILNSPIACSLPTLPFHVLRILLDSQPLTTDDGVLLRRMTLEIGALHLILACLSVLSHHGPRVPIPGFHQELIAAATHVASTGTQSTTTTTTSTSDEKGQLYWAKGTGFGTGSTTSSWDAEQALLRQKSEEEHVTCLLQVLASYVNPGGNVPKDFESPDYHPHSEKNVLPSVVPELLSQSCLVPAISSYLRNDSVLDMARHVPLYRALLELLRGIAVCPVLIPLLLPLDKEEGPDASVETLLEKMKACVDTYANRLKSKAKGKREDDDESEGLALLIPDIQDTAKITKLATDRLKDEHDGLHNHNNDDEMSASRVDASLDERYINIMGEEQFDTWEMVTDVDGSIKFTHPHHYEANVKAAGEINNPARSRRLAQEAVTLSTSLPLSASSTVFVRCDEERLDVMKILITAPSDTPYANGCFEFDVYFPQDYPNSPPLINLETTGNHTVRFNPNLYNDGKVCLSVLNTWHGRPEEKWNQQTSSFLQVLVSIQSLILVSEPYFNEPGYERSRGTPSGTASSREYDANIRQATVKWAMLEQLKNPSPCFKQVIQKHFWMKRHEIIAQIESWIQEMDSYSGDKRTGRTIALSTVGLKRHFNQLREELSKLKPPEGLEDFGCDTPVVSPGLHIQNSEDEKPSTSGTTSINYSDSWQMPVGANHIPDLDEVDLSSNQMFDDLSNNYNDDSDTGLSKTANQNAANNNTVHAADQNSLNNSNENENEVVTDSHVMNSTENHSSGTESAKIGNEVGQHHSSVTVTVNNIPNNIHFDEDEEEEEE